MKITKEKK